MLRPLVNQPPITLFMATLGLSFVLEGVVAGGVGHAVVHGLDLGIPDTPLEVKGVLISKFDLVASAIAGAMVAVLTVFFQFTRIGLAFRAVADDHQAALSVGIPLPRIWAMVWTAAGVVALVTGLLWGEPARRAVLAVADRAQGAAGASCSAGSPRSPGRSSPG